MHFGIGLLGIVYYYVCKARLIDPSVMPLEPWQAISIGIGTLLVGWVVYDQMCKSPLATKPVLFSVLGFGLLTAAAYGLCLVFSSRGAYLHMGALVGNDDGGECVFCDYSKSESHGRTNVLRGNSRPEFRAGRRIALVAQQLFHAACIVHYDQSSLSNDVRP